MLYRILTAAILSVSLGLIIPFSGFAHPDDPRLELGAERSNPGAVLDVHGFGFEPEKEIKLILTSGQIVIPIGTVTVNMDGEFTETVVLPTELAEGVYILQAVTYDHVTNSAPLTIWGTYIPTDAGDNSQREEEDGLLVPMPTLISTTSPLPPTLVEAQPGIISTLPASSFTPASSSTPVPMVKSQLDGAPSSALIYFVAVAIVVCGIGIIVSRKITKSS